MKRLSIYFSVAFAFFFGLFGRAFAALPEGVTSALDDAKADGITLAGAVLVAIIALFAFKLLRKAL